MAPLNTGDLADELKDLRERAEEGPLDEDEQAELEELAALERDVSEWHFNTTLIPEDEFEDYAREQAEQTGAISEEYAWPATHIDWKAAANELQMDYTAYEYQCTTYYARS